MAFNTIHAGELTTRIIVEIPVGAPDGKGGKKDEWKPLFGDRRTLPAKWRRRTTRMADMSDSSVNRHVAPTETATVTMRYNSRITSACRVRRVGDAGGVWYIVGSPEASVNRAWLEFTVERRVAL